MTTPELLPCPHCGSLAEVYSASDRTPDANGIVDAHWVADCTECNANIDFCWSEAEAIAAWNTRAPLSPAVLAELPEVRADAVSLNAAEERADTYRAALELITTLGNATAQRIARAALAAAIREGRNG